MKICVECRPDFITIQEFTSICVDNIVHSGGKTRVLLDLLEKYTDSKGLIDEDPGSSQLTSIKKFDIIKNYHNERLMLLYNDERNNQVIVVRPRLEGWVLRASRLSRINPADYGLPTDEASLCTLINYRLDSFRRLIQKLYSVSDCAQLLGNLLSDP